MQLLVLLALVCLSGLQGHAAEPSVGIVTRTENEAEVVSAGASTEALVGTVVHLNDELRTGANARLQVTFRDSTTLTLGEKATVAIDR